jgi:hypothetical protein
MELFRTLVPVSSSPKQITYKSPVVFIGSCFSEYMGNKVTESKFPVDNNPFGIVYNPLSVKLVLSRLLKNRLYTPDELFNFDGIWSSYDHHSRFSDVEPSVCLQKINARLESSSQFLTNAGFLFLTFGTSFVYSKKADGRVVSNCHKVPANEFVRYRLSLNDIVSAYNSLLKQLFKVNPNLQIVFTVSPVRHWKDGAHENQLSKATLLLAIDQITKTFPQTFYFPSYEIIMDDLRDYRFYEEDMLHPNKTAINYIWNRFKECFLAEDTLSIMKEIEKLVQARNHRPFNPKSEPYQAFVKLTLGKIKHLTSQYNIPLATEEAFFNSLLE